MKKLIKSFKNFVNSSKNNKKSRSLLMSAFSSVILLLSVTFAWFVSTINLNGNEISTGTLGFVAKGYDQSGNFVTTLLDEESEHDLTNPNVQQLNNPLFKIDNWSAGQYQTAYISIEMTGTLDMDYELTFNVDGDEEDIKNIGAFWYRVTEIDNSDLLYQYATNMSGGSLGVNATAIEKNYSEVIRRYIANAKGIVPCTSSNCVKENGTTKHKCTEYSDNAVSNMVTINRNSTRGTLEKVANTNNHRHIIRVDVGVCGDAIASRYTNTKFTITGKIFGTQKGAIDNPDGMGKTYYATDPNSLKELIYDAVPGDNIILNANIEYNGDLTINKCVNIYTNGRNLTINGNLVYDFVSKHTLHIDMNSGGNIYVKSKDGFGGDVQFNTPNSEVNVTSISYMGNMYVEDEVKINATRAYETDGFEISGTNILTLAGESQTFVVSSDTRLTINKGCSVYRISSARQATNIEIVNYGTIREINLSTMLLIDENPTGNFDTNYAQILINNHNSINNSIILPGWSRPFVSANDVYSGNTKIIRQWGASELLIDANACTTFTKDDITDYNSFDLSVEQLNGSDSELIVNYHDDEDEDGNLIENTIKGLLIKYFEEKLNTTGAEVTNAIENIMTLVVRTSNNKVVTVEDLNFMNTEMLRLSKLDLDLATLASHTLPANQFQNKTVLQEIVLPRNIEKIGTSALQGTRIQHISIPASILRIENSAFTGIKFATFEGSTCPEVFNGRNHGVLYMFIDEAYIDTFKAKLYGNDEKNRVYPKAEVCDDGLTAVRQVSDGYEVVLYIGEETNIVVGDNLYLNGERINVTSINAYAFRHITYNYTLSFNSSVVRIGTNAFRSGTVTEVDFNQVQLIGDNAFYDCRLLSKATLTNVNSIGTTAFYNCIGLTELDLGTTKTVGRYAFQACTGLLTLNTKEVTFVDEGGFYSCSKIVILELPNVKEIGYRGFYGMSSLTSITFESIETVGKEAFNSAKVREIYVLNESVDNLTGFSVFTLNETASNQDVHVYAREEIVTTLRSKSNFSNRVVPLGVKCGENIVTVNGINVNLGEFIVSGTPDYGVISVCKETEYIDSVLEIPEILTAVNEDGTSTTYTVREIYQYAYYRVTLEQETKIVFPDSLVRIGTYAFRNNNDSSGNAKNIVEIDFGGTETIDNYAFDNCFYLTEFNKDNNIKYIGAYSFQNCYSLVDVSLPAIESFYTDSNGYIYSFTAASSMIRFETGEYLSGKIGGSPVRGATKLRQLIFRTKQIDNISLTQGLEHGMTIHPNLKVYFSEEFINSSLISNSRLNALKDYIRKCGETYGTYEIEVTTNYGKTLTVDIGAYTYSEVQLSDSESTYGISLHGVNYDVEDYTYDRLSVSEINGQPIVLLDYQCFRVTNFGGVERIGEAKENYSIPETVKELAANAFVNNTTIRFSNLKNVEIARASAMQGCTNIYMMDAPELRIVYGNAFNGMSRILKFNAPKLTEIAAAGAFTACPKMVSLITAVEKVYDANALWWDRTSLQELIVNTSEETSSTYKPKYDYTIEMIVLGSSKNLYTTRNDTNQRLITDVKKVGSNIIEAIDDDGTVIYSFDLGQYYINAEGDEVTIYKYLNPYVYEDFYIPSRLDGRDVTKIGKYAFNSVDFQSNSLYLPNTITTIENFAFNGSYIGGSLNLNNVSSIGSYSFQTNKFVRVTAPKVANLSSYSFNANSLLEEVYAPVCTAVSSDAFKGCSSLNVLRFSYLPTVSDRSIPSNRNITVILEGVIDETHALPTEATIARWKNTTYVPYQPAKNTFLVPYLHLEEYKTTNLDNYYIMKHYGTVFDINSETYVLDDLGDSWKILSLITTKETVVIPESYNGKNITQIDSNAFISASSVKNITLPRYYSYFEDLAFNNAVSLENISVDANNTKFTAVNGVLYSKDMKELIYYPSKKTDETFEISDDVYVIRSYAFAGNDYLKNLKVGSNVMVISAHAFEETLLISIEFTSTTVPYATSSNIFDSNNDSLTIYVPESALEDYQKVNAFQIYTIVGK